MKNTFVPQNTQERFALEIATFAHEGQKRKGSDLPYIVHPLEVANFLQQSGANSDAITSALLHDVLEDVDPSRYGEADMVRNFGERIVSIVKTVSKPPHSAGDWQYRNDIYLQQIADTLYQEAVEVCTADKLSNIIATLEDYEAHGDALWARFNAGKERQQWWYSAVHEIVEARLPDNELVKELGKKVLILNTL